MTSNANKPKKCRSTHCTRTDIAANGLCRLHYQRWLKKQHSLKASNIVLITWYKTIRLPQLEGEKDKQRGTPTHWRCPKCKEEWFDLTPEERAGLPVWHQHHGKYVFNSPEAPDCLGLAADSTLRTREMTVRRKAMSECSSPPIRRKGGFAIATLKELDPNWTPSPTSA